MSGLAFLFIGLALGWALEFLIDAWFWGRRYRRIEAKLKSCLTDFKASEQKVDEIQSIVAQYQTKEGEYQKCQHDLANLVEKQHQLEALSIKMSNEVEASKKNATQLSEKVAELKSEREHLTITVEEVDQWVESTLRQRIWENGSWKSTLNRSMARSAVYLRSQATAASSRIGNAAGKLKNSATGVKAHIRRTFRAGWPKRLFNRCRCAAWTVINMLYKKSKSPDTCSTGPDQ